jgi:hypothetical protein
MNATHHQQNSTAVSPKAKARNDPALREEATAIVHASTLKSLICAVSVYYVHSQYAVHKSANDAADTL